jgi:hypothetical protein
MVFVLLDCLASDAAVRGAAWGVMDPIRRSDNREKTGSTVPHGRIIRIAHNQISNAAALAGVTSCRVLLMASAPNGIVPDRFGAVFAVLVGFLPKLLLSRRHDIVRSEDRDILQNRD